LAERDGLFSALLILEALSAMKMSITEAVAFLQKEFGPYHSGRIDLENISFDQQSRILGRLKKSSPARIAGHLVTGLQALDGVRFNLEGGWVMVRPSGTEPLLRLYAEASSPRKVQALLDAVRTEAQRK
jgi:phosphomannomutase